MSIRVGILGYGNLGRGVECAIRQNPDMELKAVFTRRAPETVKILTEGADPADMAIESESGDQLKVIKNEEMAEALGIDLSVLDA